MEIENEGVAIRVAADEGPGGAESTVGRTGRVQKRLFAEELRD